MNEGEFLVVYLKALAEESSNNAAAARAWMAIALISIAVNLVVLT